jgi:cation diffusion facilitator family transporter
MSQRSLTRFAWLSVAAAGVTIGLKAAAYWLTGSVSLFSDALESLVNLAAALMALAMLRLAARPPDAEHPYGHGNAEYFSSGFEGLLIVAAAIGIAAAAWNRLTHPQPLQEVDTGLALALCATLINFIVACLLLQAGRRYRSITLEADGRHLMTDVWTSLGVVLGIVAVMLTGWQPLDPIIALLVAANIVWSGINLMQRSASGLLDAALPAEECAKIQNILTRYQDQGIGFHELRTRQSGVRRSISLHVLVPGDWTIQRGHDLSEQIERELDAALPDIAVYTHLEPMDDAASYAHSSECRPVVEHASPDVSDSSSTPGIADPRFKQPAISPSAADALADAATRQAPLSEPRQAFVGAHRRHRMAGVLLIFLGTGLSMLAQGWLVDAALVMSALGFIAALWPDSLNRPP